MPDALDFSSLSLGWLIAIIIVVALFGVGGYFIASRRIKQPLAIFFARFAVVFLLLIVLEAVVLTVAPSVHEAIGHVTATLVGALLGAVGVTESVSGSTIALEQPFLLFSIDAACLGGLLLWAYTALVLAESKASARQRATGIIIGIAILIGFNFFRIVLSVYLQWLTEVRVHDYFYVVNMLVVLLVWAGWVRTLRPGRPGPATARPQQHLRPGPQSD
jgi:exosortase/archaeosortase family protein